MRHRRVVPYTGFGLLVLGVLGAAAQSVPGVSIQLFQFRPGQQAARAGSRVTWTNQDDIEHTVTSGTPERRDGRFELRLRGQGAAGSVEFTQPGAYPYFCDRHPSMRGEIRVD